MTNKTKGSNLERKIINEINEFGLGFDLGSSRYYNRYMDDMKVDIVDKPLSVKKFPYHIQCKSITGYVKYHDIFADFKLKDKPLVIFHELTEKHGTRFFKLQDYVILKKEDFYELIKKLENG